MRECSFDNENPSFLSNFSGRKKTFYQFSIRGKEGEDEEKDRIEKCTEGVKKLCLAKMSINM